MTSSRSSASDTASRSDDSRAAPGKTAAPAPRHTGNASTPDASEQLDQSRVDSPSPDAVKDPAEWTTGSESMTGAQASYLHTLAHEAGEEVDETLTKAEASQKIDELRAQTGRGIDH